MTMILLAVGIVATNVSLLLAKWRLDRRVDALIALHGLHLDGHDALNDLLKGVVKVLREQADR